MQSRCTPPNVCLHTYGGTLSHLYRHLKFRVNQSTVSSCLLFFVSPRRRKHRRHSLPLAARALPFVSEPQIACGSKPFDLHTLVRSWFPVSSHVTPQQRAPVTVHSIECRPPRCRLRRSRLVVERKNFPICRNAQAHKIRFFVGLFFV